MTLKQQKTLQLLAKNNYNVSKSMREAGYTKYTASCGTEHNRLRKLINKLDPFSPEAIKKKIDYVYKFAKKQKDITNMNRNLEHQAKIAGIIVDRSEVDNKNPNQIIIGYSKPKLPNELDTPDKLT